MTSTTDNTNLNPERTRLYKMAGISALMLLVIVILQFIVFIIAPSRWTALLSIGSHYFKTTS